MRAVLPLFLCFLTAQAWAEWVVISKTAGGTIFYLDPQSLQKDGELRRISTLMNLKEKNKAGKQSARALEEYDCKAEQNRVLSFSDHSEPFAMGQTLVSDDSPTPWKNLAPGTLGQAILLLVCALNVEKPPVPMDKAVDTPVEKPGTDDWWRYEGKGRGRQ